MKVRYQYRIYPNPLQARMLARTFGCVRVVYNDALALVKSVPEGEKWPKNSELQKLVITQAKKTPERSWLSEVSSISLQQSVADLGVAFKNWFASLKGKGKSRFPRFKKLSNTQSARFTRSGFSLKGNKLFLAKMGNFKVKWSRPLPSEPSSVTIIKNTANQYYASFVVEVEPKVVEPIRQSIGIDLGIKTFGFLSNGERIVSPNYDKIYKKIKRFQRQFSKQLKGSNRRELTRLKIAKLNLKVSNIRKDFLHKESTKLIRENQTVSLEDLNVKGMLKNRKLSRVIAQQGWSIFRTMLQSKVVQYVNRVVNIINRWEPTSQVCSSCGYRWGKIDLSVRAITCMNCGTVHDRDENASKNIDQVGVGQTHDVKWTRSGHKTTQVANHDETSNRKVENPSGS